LAATLSAIVFGLGGYGECQTHSPQCRADGSSRDESGRPHCCADGSLPDGESSCWCETRIVRGDYRNPKLEYEVHLPDNIAEILNGCSATGFIVSLAHPESGEGDWAVNQIHVSGADGSRKTFQQMIDAWHRRLKEDGEGNPDSDQQLSEPEQTSLSSLPALRFRSARTEGETGRVISEAIIANNPDKDIVYLIGMSTPADRYEKNEKLFKEIVDGFRYTPAGQRSISMPE